jgi:Abnormal spindle-like microcephaly-assoc'd, ASPM-SPD-2-Hydin
MNRLPPQSLAVLFSFMVLVVCSVPRVYAASDVETSSPAEADARHSKSRLLCEPCRMDFGKVRVGESKALPVVLKNEGRTPITISTKQKRAPWVSPRGLVLPYTLLPGGRVRFHLVYSPRDAQRVVGRIAYHSNASNQVLPISVTADSSTGGTLAATPTYLNFGSVAAGKTSTLTQTIKNVGNESVSIEQVSEAGSGFAVGSLTMPQILAPGHSVTFSVQFDPQKAANYAGSLILLSNATNYRLSVSESGTGTSAGSVSISPASLSFGNVAVGSTETKTLTLTATGTSMTVKSDALSSSEYSISGLSLPLKLGAGKSVTFKAVFSPQASGAANGKLSLTVASPTSTIQASLSGTGTTGTQHSVSLSWNADTSAVAGYNVYRGSKANGSYTRITSSLDTATDYVDTSVTGGDTYYYEVTAVNDQGEESAPTKPVSASVP